jgi:hypothetical protein
MERVKRSPYVKKITNCPYGDDEKGINETIVLENGTYICFYCGEIGEITEKIIKNE